ncbi:carboxypeptidase-like regulatory domain-containing protein [Foetidibacter luteolus]|uniref:carboxypeptidase-like regulatory domain-containing protein n=1 Tax=Foetidibacter luteolus TaxID=2608880 RepID=UPI001A98736A|nr:carboxypeptidase-like regulatory domain-containing protein [Foetidibacter luteolus]
MKEKISLHVPTPCHEDWNKMTPTQQGRFCGSCAKQVVDFSLMTDQQVLNYFRSNTGNTCGRFMGSQLQRPLQPTAIESKKSWWIALMMPVLLLFDKADAQKNKKQPLLNIAALKNNPPDKDVLPPTKIPTRTVLEEEILFTGMVSSKLEQSLKRDLSTLRDTLIEGSKILTLSGIVVDRKMDPIPGTSIVVKGTKIGTAAGMDGNFKLGVPVEKPGTLVLVVSSIGFQVREWPVEVNAATFAKSDTISLEVAPMQCDEALSGEVVVVGGFTKKRQGIASIFPKLLPFKEWFRNTAFRVYPNPAITGTNINIDLKKEGDYTIQLNDNKGVPHLVKKITVVKGATVVPVTIPAQLTSGMYHILVTDEKKKKRYSDKIIIE